MAVTDLNYIKKIYEGTEVEISGWESDVPFVCKLKPVSLFGMINEGKIPNPLLTPVMALFDGKKDKIDKITAKEMTDIIDLFCRQTLVEPNYEEVKEFLTDVQRTEIFNYAQGGLKQLEKFRSERKRLVSDLNSDRLQKKTK